MIRNYIKIALRNLKKYKQFSLINILGLSMAISVAMAMLLYVQDELSYDHLHPNASHLYRISMRTLVAENEFHSAWTPPFIGARLNSDVPEVENFATLYKHFKGFSIKKHDQEIPVNDVYYATSNFFEVFGFTLKYGNPEIVLKDPGNIVLHENLVEKLFPGESIMGHIIETTDGPKKVSGIIKASVDNFHFTPQVITSLAGHWGINDLATTVNFDASFYNYILLSNESTLTNEKLNRLGASYFDEWISADESRKNDFGDQKIELQIQNVKDIHLKSHLEFEMEANGNYSIVVIFSFIAILILVVASINYMNLASARYLERMKELGIRKVLGSRRTQLAMQFFVESLVITIISACIALMILQIALPFYNEISGKQMELIQLYAPESLLGLLIIVIGCAFFSSLYPALFIFNIKPVRIFQMKSVGFSKGNGFRKAMLVFQVTASGALIIFTFVLFQQLKFMQKHELGFQKEQVIVIEIKAQDARSKIPVLKNDLLTLSSISSIALTGQIPGSDNLKTEPMSFESNDGAFNEMLTNYMFSGPDLIGTLGLKLLEGENFDGARGGANRGQEVLVNQSMVDAMNWTDPIGKKVKLPIGEAKVVGVVSDFHLKSLHHKIQPLTIIYLDNWAEALLVKTNSQNLPQTIKEVENIYKKTLGDAELDYGFLDDRFAMQYQSDRQKMYLFMVFSVLTIIIASMGLIGLIGFSLARRSKEISIRRVFGANSWKIILLFSREYAYVIVIGLSIAIPVANYFIKDWLMHFPYKINLSPMYFTIPVVLVIMLTALIIGLRTYAASMANPADKLRNE